MTAHITIIWIIAILIFFKLLEIRYLITNKVSYNVTMITCLVDMLFSLVTIIIYSFVLKIAGANYFTLSCYISCILAQLMALIAMLKG